MSSTSSVLNSVKHPNPKPQAHTRCLKHLPSPLSVHSLPFLYSFFQFPYFLISLLQSYLFKNPLSQATVRVTVTTPSTHHSYFDVGRGWSQCECRRRSNEGGDIKGFFHSQWFAVNPKVRSKPRSLRITANHLGRRANILISIMFLNYRLFLIWWPVRISLQYIFATANHKNQVVHPLPHHIPKS